MPFFSRVFKSKDAGNKKQTAPVANGHARKHSQWSDAWIRTRVDPEEVVELLHLCTAELKARALDVPFLLLPFRPSSDPSAARTFVRNFFSPPYDRERLAGVSLQNELRMSEVMVLISVMKWCWARLPGGVVTWEVFEGFRVGEKDSGFAQDAFSTFIPISTTSTARVQIIQDFFDLLAAVAAHSKANGLGGHKLSRYAGWWAFEHYDSGKGFESGYESWASAADASSHLFFAYLRSLSPGPGKTSGILTLPRSLQQLVDSTMYPPRSGLLSNDTTKVVMIVDVVSPTPYALLRRARNFEYRDDDAALQQFASFEDPVEALTDECRRVLKAISSANQSHVSNANTLTSLTDPSWSRFEDIGFDSSLGDEDDGGPDGLLGRKRIVSNNAYGTRQGGYQDLARPTTPSWADFLSSGFADERGNKSHAPMLLPPDKMLPPVNSTTQRGQSSQSHRRNLDMQQALDPGELASITRVNVDDGFWWVWISSLAPEEPTARKAVFGRCALIETGLTYGRWMVMEEQVKGAAPEPIVGAYIAEKKTFLGFSTKRRLARRKSGTKKSPLSREPQVGTNNRAILAPDQQAKIQEAAAELTRRKAAEEEDKQATVNARRGRMENAVPQSKTNSVFTVGPMIKDEASPALQWASQYDKKAIRAKYLGDSLAGRGSREMLTLPSNGLGISRSASTLSVVSKNKELPAPPQDTSVRHVPLERSRSAEAPSVPVAVVETAALPTEPTIPVEPEVAPEAAEVPLPPATPDLAEARNSKQPSAKLRKSMDGKRPSPEQKKNRTKGSTRPPAVQQKSGFRRLFGKQRKSEEHVPATSSSVAAEEEEDPAVAAARRALEGGILPTDTPASPPLSPGHFHRLATVTSPQGESQTNLTAPQTPQLNEAQDMKQSYELPVEAEYNTQREPTYEPPAPPRIRRDEEYDQLSRVDTNEREHADREFSTFDQGPLVDQPAFVPADTPPRDTFLTPFEEMPQPIVGIPSNRSLQRNDSMIEEEDELDMPRQADPTDRWAQIRKNAAERAARQSEKQSGRSRTETRTDDGETSGEETIESRVARIKARVAELTGNMDATRR